MWMCRKARPGWRSTWGQDRFGRNSAAGVGGLGGTRPTESAKFPSPRRGPMSSTPSSSRGPSASKNKAGALDKLGKLVDPKASTDASAVAAVRGAAIEPASNSVTWMSDTVDVSAVMDEGRKLVRDGDFAGGGGQIRRGGRRRRRRREGFGDICRGLVARRGRQHRQGRQASQGHAIRRHMGRSEGLALGEARHRLGGQARGQGRARGRVGCQALRRRRCGSRQLTARRGCQVGS